MKTKKITQVVLFSILAVAGFQSVSCLGAEDNQTSTMTSDSSQMHSNASSASSSKSGSQMTNEDKSASGSSADDNQFVWWNPISWFKWTKNKLGF